MKTILMTLAVVAGLLFFAAPAAFAHGAGHYGGFPVGYHGFAGGYRGFAGGYRGFAGGYRGFAAAYRGGFYAARFGCGYGGRGFGLYAGPGYGYGYGYPYGGAWGSRYCGCGYGCGYGWGHGCGCYGYGCGYPCGNAITVLVTDCVAGVCYTHYVTASWNSLYGGYWYYDVAGNYRRAR